MVKKLAGLLFAVLLGVAFSNTFFIDKPIEVDPVTWEGKTPLFRQAAPIIQESCLNCHSSMTQKPWYAGLPGVKQLIEHDIHEAREDADLEAELFTKGKAPSKKVLMQIESEIEDSKMPPLKYSVLHWNAFISSQEKKVLLDWVQEQQRALDEEA